MMSTNSRKATITTPSDTEIVITRMFDAPRALVFEAMTTPEHVLRWWGPRQYENTVCEIDLREGGTWRFGQRLHDGTDVIFSGTYREIDVPKRLVYTECYEAMPELVGVITATFDEHDGRTTLTNVCQYGSKETRDAILASGMETGLQETYDQLDEVLATL